MSLVEEEDDEDDDDNEKKEKEPLMTIKKDLPHRTTKYMPQDAPPPHASPSASSGAAFKGSRLNTILKEELPNPTTTSIAQTANQKTQQHALYLHIHSASPQAIRYSLHTICVTDNLNLLHNLFVNDLSGGGSCMHYILRHALFTNSAEEGNNIEEEDCFMRRKKNGEMIGRTIFWLCCYCGSYRVFEFLVKECFQHFRRLSGGDGDSKARKALCCLLDIETGLGSKPVLIAAAKNHSKIISILLQYGVNPNTTNRYGITAATIASLLNHVDVLTVLSHDSRTNFNSSCIEKNIQDSEYTEDSWSNDNYQQCIMSPAHAACEGGHLDALRFLYNLKKKDVGVKEDEDGNVVLGGVTNIVDFTVYNGDGYSCAGIAALYNRVRERNRTFVIYF
uniref:Uncharacterized protein n=1 Tax=Ditylum brightwellii TaxID=49249 RepID=A0A7S4RHZ6_9STRA